MTGGDKPLRVQDELTDETIAAAVYGSGACLGLGILLIDRRWWAIGLQLALAIGLGTAMGTGRRRRDALRNAPPVPTATELVSPAVLLLRPLGHALLMGVVFAVDKDFGRGAGLAFFGMFAVSSAVSARRLAALQPAGERFVRTRSWSYAGKVFRMSKTPVTGRWAVRAGVSRRRPGP